jgi:PAS domain S-box-containing protein
MLAMSRQGSPVSNREAKRKRKDGTLFDALVSTAPLSDPDGRFVGTIGIVSDISEWKRMGRALQESETRFRSLVENALAGICIIRDGRVVFRNPEHDRLFGSLPEFPEIRNLAEVHPEDRPKFDGLCDAIESASDAVAGTDFRFFVSAGGPGETRMRWVHCRATPINLHARKSVLLTTTDITRVKELEQMVQSREKMAALGQVAAGIAHEIRNPLSAINIHLSTLDRILEDADHLPEEERSAGGTAVSQARLASRKMASVVRRVMDFAKPTPPRLKRINVNSLVEEVFRLSRTEMRDRGIALETSLSPDPPQCPADPSLLQQVLLNLIQNAAKALETTEGSKRVEIGTSLEEGRLVLRVSDSGPGVPTHLRQRIFDPFFTTRTDGHGIGLSFCHRVISDHGGSLTVGTSPWGGAEFRIVLPVAQTEPVP